MWLGFYIDQSYTLTPNQIRSLALGNWYVAMTLDGTNYLGQLAPQYATAEGPIGRPIFDSPIFATNYLIGNEYYVLSKDGHSARMLLNGFASIDRFYLPMTYAWSVRTADNAAKLVFTSTGLEAKMNVPVGSYILTLQADDAIATGIHSGFYLNVITANQAVSFIGIVLSDCNPPTAQSVSLNRVLSAAAADFDRGWTLRGCVETSKYLTLVKKYQFDQETTSYLSMYAQRILDTYNPLF